MHEKQLRRSTSAHHLVSPYTLSTSFCALEAPIKNEHTVRCCEGNGSMKLNRLRVFSEVELGQKQP